MKIVYIYTALVSIGGADRVLTEKANYLAEKLNYEVFIITDSQKGKAPIFPLSNKVKHIDLNIDFSKEYNHKLIGRAICYFKLMRLYKRRLKYLLYKIKPDFVLSLCGRELDFLQTIKDGSIKIGESHIAKQYCRNFHLLEKKGFPYNIIANYWRHKQEHAIKKLDAFVVLTQKDADNWSKICKAHVIPNPIPFAPNNPSDCTSKKIISVGRLNEQKGYERLIEAWSIICNKYPDWELNIYGQGEQYNLLTSQIKNLNIEKNIHINAPTSDIINKYCESSIYAMSSRFEGFPMVLLEAMVCGLPCISFDCPNGPSDLIQNNKNGFLIANNNIPELSKSLSTLIEDKELRIKMGKESSLLVKKYSPDFIMEKWHNLFITLKK